MTNELEETKSILYDLRDRAVKLSDVRQLCMELIERGDTTPQEERMLYEILKVSGMEFPNNEH